MKSVLRRLRLPAFTHTIRFRLTVLYSGLLFVLTALVLLGTYLAVERSGEAKPVTKQFSVTKIVNGEEVGEFDAVKVEQVEAAVNYETLANLRRFSLALLGGLAVASLAIGWILSGRALRPVRAISRTAADIQATDLSQRIRLGGPKDELRDLADTVDSMLDRLDEAFRAQRQLIDDASHELRSPLAIIRANVDAVLTAEESDEEERRIAARSVDRATTRMTRLVEDLLATARRSAPALADADVDLATAASEACEDFTPSPPNAASPSTAASPPASPSSATTTPSAAPSATCSPTPYDSPHPAPSSPSPRAAPRAGSGSPCETRAPASSTTTSPASSTASGERRATAATATDTQAWASR